MKRDRDLSVDPSPSIPCCFGNGGGSYALAALLKSALMGVINVLPPAVESFLKWPLIDMGVRLSRFPGAGAWPFVAAKSAAAYGPGSEDSNAAWLQLCEWALGFGRGSPLGDRGEVFKVSDGGGEWECRCMWSVEWW